MNETEIEALVIRLIGDNSGLIRTLTDSVAEIKQTAANVETAAKQIEGFGSSLKGYAAAVAGYFAAIGVKDFLRDSFEQFAEAEAAEMRLTAAVKANGGSVDELLPKYRDFAAAIQGVTTAEDDAVIAMLAHVESLGLSGDAAQRAVRNSIALAAAKGGEASAYIRLTAALEQGESQMLGRFLPALRQIKDDGERAAAAQQLLANMFDVAKAEAESSAGQIKRLGVAWGNFKEDLGAVVSEGVGPIVAGLKETIAWVSSASKEAKTFGVVFLVTTALIIGGIGAVAAASVALYKLWTVMSGGTLLIVAAVGALVVSVVTAAATVAGLVVSFGGVGAVIAGIKAKALAAWEWLRPVRMAVISLGEAIMERLTEAWNYVKVSAIVAWAQAMFVARTALAAMGIDAADLRTKVVIAFLAVEYAIRNVGDVGKLVWLGLQLGAVKLGDYLKYLFETVIPTYAKYAAGVMDDLTHGRAVRDLPKLPAQQVSELQKQIQAEWDKLGGLVGEDFQTFAARKMAEFAKRPVDEAKKTGDEIGLGIGGAATKALEKFQAAAFGSAEALSRVEDFRNRLAGIDTKAAGGNKRVDAAAFRGGDAVARKDDQLDVLKNILNEIRKGNQEPGVNLLPAGVANA